MSRHSRLVGLSAPSPNKDEGSTERVANQPKEEKKEQSSKRNNATTQQRNTGNKEDGVDIVALSRSLLHDTVRSSNYRLSAAEKDALDDLVFSLKRSGFRSTSAVEILRTAINSLVADYAQNGEQSVIHRVLALRHRTYMDE